MTTNTAPLFIRTLANKVTTPFGAFDDFATALTLQADGKLVLAGYHLNANGNYDFALTRTTVSGSLDNSFGTGGQVTTDFGTGNDFVTALSIQPDGKLVLAGYSNVNGNYDFTLTRYNATGDLDNSFGSNGKVTSAVGAFDDFSTALHLQSDGKVVVAGYSLNASSHYNFALTRYDSHGNLDASFGNGGKVTTDFATSYDFATALTVQSDNKTVVAGYSNVNGNYDFALSRYDINGNLDPSFGNGGKVTTDFKGFDDFATALTLQADGKLVLAGYSYNGSNYDFTLSRYDTNGNLDASFGNGGKVTTDFKGFDDAATALTLQPDGKLVLAGYSNVNGNNDFALSRYDTNGNLDPSFGNGGKVTTDFNASDDVARGLVLQGTQLVVAGSSNAQGNYDFALTRYNNDGSLVSPSANPRYSEQGAAVAINPPIITDPQLDSLNDYNGMAVTLTRQGGANADDMFSIDSTGAAFSVYESFLIASNSAFASFSADKGALSIHFINATTAQLVNAVMQQVRYANNAENLPANVQLNLHVDDANSGAQGEGGALSSDYLLTIDSLAVNDAPVGTSKTVSTLTNSAYKLTASDFGFTDPNDTPADAFSHVIISQLPSAGSLRLFATTVAVGQVISMADIALGALQFTPALNGVGNNYAKIGFQVQDDGGVAYGGVDTDSQTRLLTINVRSPNTLPTGAVTIKGNLMNGQVLTATNTLADADGLGVISYTWHAGKVTLSKGKTYTLTSKDVGKILSVTASYTDLLGTAEQVKSKLTTAVVDKPSAGVVITGTDFITNEKGDSAVFKVSLATAPLRDVKLTFSSSASNYGVISQGASLTFTAKNWATPQTLTIKGQSDTLIDGDIAYSISVKISTLDVIYKSVHVNNLALSNQDVSPVESLSGSNGIDILQGTNAPSYLLGFAGDDDLSGGGGNDKIYGDYGDDGLYGEDGNDALYGEQDDDYLNGGKGNDTLDGGLGLDTLVGGAGNDTYYLGYDATDVIQDKGLSSDSDTVIMPYQLTRYTLPAGIETGTITAGTTASDLTGNSSDNALKGNDGNNALVGMLGRDSLYAALGNDTLNGGTGSDTLSGGAGKDVFKFDVAPTSVSSDTITDFKPIDDTIQLKTTAFKGLGKGVLPASNFIIGNAALDRNDHLIYNKSTGVVYFDDDGNGAHNAVAVVTVGVSLNLTYADFVVVV